jgi:hypothetical protein
MTTTTISLINATNNHLPQFDNFDTFLDMIKAKTKFVYISARHAAII